MTPTDNTYLAEIKARAERFRDTDDRAYKPDFYQANADCLKLVAMVQERDAEIARLKDMFATKADLLQRCEKGHIWRTAYGPGCPFCRENDLLRKQVEVAREPLLFYRDENNWLQKPKAACSAIIADTGTKAKKALAELDRLKNEK